MCVCVCICYLYARDVINQGGILHHFLNPHGPLSIMLKMCAGHLRRYKMIETIIYNWVIYDHTGNPKMGSFGLCTV